MSVRHQPKKALGQSTILSAFAVAKERKRQDVDDESSDSNSLSRSPDRASEVEETGSPDPEISRSQSDSTRTAADRVTALVKPEAEPILSDIGSY